LIEVNKIYNMDCLEGLKLIPDNSIDLVVTDPPYEIETSGAGIYKQADKQYVKELNFMKDGFSKEILDECCRVMKKINIYIFCSQKQIIPLLDYFVRDKKCNWNIITWHKTNPVPACGNKYLTDTEFVLFFREKGVKIRGEFKTKFTYYVTPLNQKDKKLYGHPTVKPLNIVENFIINSSQEGDVVLDPFMGSGTTAVAAIRNNRQYIGFELSEEYCKIAAERIANIDDIPDEEEPESEYSWLDELLEGSG
jgi:site-specific DNA-methyltransferase (adenine-specific)